MTTLILALTTHPLAVLQDVSWQSARTWLLTDGLRILVTVVLAAVVRWVLHRLITRFVSATTTKSAPQAGGAEPGRAPARRGRRLRPRSATSSG